ncbi:MAG: hypothetical protein IJU08_06325 [Bacteroidales bacterium]|nr:hypothetical protein [Bacteroidales bacterium]
MKATKYIAAFAIMLGLVACQPNELFNGDSNADAENVEVTFSVQFPEPIPVATKAPMGETPTADKFDVYLCLFGSGDGAFQNWIKATDVTLTTTTAGTTGTFKALLPVSDDQRTVHIFVNPPVTTAPSASDYIDLVMENMVTTGGEGAYWQEIVLTHGIYPDPNNGLKAHQDIQNAFKDVQLLRNFAKIIVDGPTEGEDLFVLKSWGLINVPTKGYVAPYTRKQDGRSRFPVGYSNAFLKTEWTASSLLTQLVETDNYLGFMPPVTGEEKIINTDFPQSFLGNSAKTYMYERPIPDPNKPEEKQTAVLIEIEFLPDHALYNPHTGEGLTTEQLSAANTYWYKVEVLDNEGSYVPILRNFVYKMHILGLEERGETTAQAAYDGPYYGNISASLETASLSELSNGKSTIYAKTLDYTIMGNPGSFILLENSDFYFIPNLTEFPDEMFWKTTTGKCTFTYQLVNVAGYPMAIEDITNVSFSGNDDGTGAGTIYIKPNANTGTMKKSIIRIKATGTASNSKELYRDIMITLMQKPSFVHGDDETCIFNADTVKVQGTGNEVALRIWLPEGLGASLFPIQVRIEAEKNTLSATTPDLPVQTGKSLFDPTRNTFFYIFTIKYSDYCWLNPQTRKYENKYYFDCKLFTNTSGDNRTPILISDLRGIKADGTVDHEKELFNSTTLTLQAPTTPNP